MPEALRLRGELNRGALDKTVQAIVNRHESLRTRFAEIHGEAVQIVEPAMRIEIPLEDLSALPKEEQSQRVAAATRQEWQRAFDLSRRGHYSV